ncbi:receptor-type tyrosine-protein phosphatase T [Platysternon megacephalum]|uniref:Receptor-type tyrosine-protein phosphatase T n=1 Tax=Platysternon megacephalum TaxID=55544 RepID=A0A4D9EHN3_9SAUR|nr:receptor-type tyrosine-protein phosphatase T [Platysternon megacephalum]
MKKPGTKSSPQPHERSLGATRNVPRQEAARLRGGEAPPASGKQSCGASVALRVAPAPTRAAGQAAPRPGEAAAGDAYPELDTAAGKGERAAGGGGRRESTTWSGSPAGAAGLAHVSALGSASAAGGLSQGAAAAAGLGRNARL